MHDGALQESTSWRSSVLEKRQAAGHDIGCPAVGTPPYHPCICGYAEAAALLERDK